MRTAVWMARGGIKSVNRKVQTQLPSGEKLTHVQATSDAGTSQRLVSSVLLTGLHETRHLILSKSDLAATEGGQRDISDLELVGWGGHSEVLFGGRNVRKRLLSENKPQLTRAK